jgi:Uma2 family endonuclease
MTTMLKLGPADEGRPLTLDEFMAADYAEGYRYELIDGKLSVAAQPNAPQGLVERWIYRVLDRYSDRHPEVINFVYNKTRVFIPSATGLTNPEPDVAAYRDFPIATPEDVRWQEATPILVVEVLSPDDPDKDLVRNRDLYLLVPSIKEYWVFDSRGGATQPALVVHRRHGRSWRISNHAGGETYTTRLLPGFQLQLDIRT